MTGIFEIIVLVYNILNSVSKFCHKYRDQSDLEQIPFSRKPVCAITAVLKSMSNKPLTELFECVDLTCNGNLFK